MTPRQYLERQKKMAAPKKTKPEAAHKRRGLKSSEFWLAAVTSILTLAILGGWIDIAEGTTTADRACAIIAMGLSSLGYTVGRSWIKTKTAEVEE
jgi:hypothetical protein